MATIKHTSSKNSDLTAPEHYLTFQHNEYTGLPLLDENGRPKLREEYLLDTLECGGQSFAMACLLANRKYGKNFSPDDVKTHQYIISFDPRDAADNGLNLEKAQALGLQFCKENFPGHPAIVCSHPDGHNGAGNIHVHIVIGSVRIRTIPRQPYMEKPCDWQEGMKHRCTAAMLRHLRVETMELCQEARLYQIDLLNGTGERITEKEYWAQRRGQRRLDHANQKATASGQPIRQTKYETEKAALRRQIRSVLTKATSLEEFSAQLLQEHGVTVRESRGRFSYLTAGRTKPISSRKLGDDFSKDKVLAVLAENAERKKTAKLYSSDPHPDRISRLIDIQAKLAAGKGAGYEHWAKIFNLKQLAKSMVLFTRYNLNSEEELDTRVKELAEKKSRTFPTGNALPSIDAFFKLGASFGAHPFSFIVKMERIRLSELSISGNVLGEALSERCPDSASRIKPKIRTLLPQEKGSDFLDLVRVVIQNFSKTIVVQFVFWIVG